MKTKALLLPVVLVASALAAEVAPSRSEPKPAPAIPATPDLLRFKPVEYIPPVAADHRAVLKNGMIVFLVPDPALPLVNLSLLVRTGSYIEPAEQAGLAELTGSLIRQGGSRSLSAEDLDEKLDYLAAQVSTSIGETSGTASLNCLSDNLDEALGVFVEMLREPRFQQDRLDLAKQQKLQELKQRNDDSRDIEQREWNVLLNGPKHFSNRFVTDTTLSAISRGDLQAFHRRYFHPANMIAAVSGAFLREEMLAKLESAFAHWPGQPPQVEPVPSALGQTAEPGLYRVQKEVPQGRVSLGLPGVRRNHPDVYALEVMNEILGGSGFTSRITKTVRSDEGLAYSAGSAMSFGIYYPGRFRAGFQSKSRSVAYATELVLAEIRKLRDAPVGAEELDTIKRNLIETFPSNFASPAQTMSVFAADEYTGRPSDYWATYRPRILAVSAAEVQRVAREHLIPEKLIVLVVGDQKEIALGDPKHPAKLEELVSGSPHDLPLRDPLTMQPR